MHKAFLGLWRNSVWAFLGFLLASSGLGNLTNPEMFAPMTVLNNVSVFLIQAFGMMSFVGGVTIIAGVLVRSGYVEAAGWFLALPAILIAFTVFVLTGGWNRISVDIIYIGFILVILSRMQVLRLQAKELKLARELLAKLKERELP